MFVFAIVIAQCKWALKARYTQRQRRVCDVAEASPPNGLQSDFPVTGNLIAVAVTNAGLTVQHQNNRTDFRVMSQSLNVNGPQGGAGGWGGSWARLSTTESLASFPLHHGIGISPCEQTNITENITFPCTTYEPS